MPPREPIVYVYMRTSTTMQDVESGSQMPDIKRYLEYKNLDVNEKNIVREQLSGSVDWKKRKLHDLLTNKCVPGDILVVSELSRLSRNSSELVIIIDFCKKNEIVLHACKENLTISKDDMTSNILTHVYAMIAQTEKQFTQARVKASLATKKQNGVRLGPPLSSPLDEKREYIERNIENGVTVTELSAKMNISYSMLYKYCRIRKIINSQEDRKKNYQKLSRDEAEVDKIVLSKNARKSKFDPYIDEINEMLYRKKSIKEIALKYNWNYSALSSYIIRRRDKTNSASDENEVSVSPIPDK